MRGVLIGFPKVAFPPNIIYISSLALLNKSSISHQHALLTPHWTGWQESEGEEAAETRVLLPQDLGRGNIANRQSRVRLQEVSQIPK